MNINIVLSEWNNKTFQVIKNGLKNNLIEVSDIAGFNKIAFPLVRKVFSQLLTNNIVSVQPMQMPSGLVFSLDFTYDTTKTILKKPKPKKKIGFIYFSITCNSLRKFKNSEEELNNLISCSMANEIDKLIIKDLKNKI